jgi:hypothetical protein
MSIIAGFTFCFVSPEGAIRQITVADPDDRRCETLVSQLYGSVELLFPAGVDHRELKLLRLKHG